MNVSKINNEPLRLMLKLLNYNLVFAKLAFLQLGFQLPEFSASMTRAFCLASCSSTNLGECKTGDSVYEGLVARCCTIGWQSLSRKRWDHWLHTCSPDSFFSWIDCKNWCFCNWLMSQALRIERYYQNS